MRLSLDMKPVYDYNITMTNDWKGSKNPRWNGGKRTLTSGHIMVTADKNQHSVCKDGYILEHRMIIEKHIGRKLTKKEIVHHINHKPYDNRLENLELISSQSEHMKKEHNHIGNYKKLRIFTKCMECGRSDVKNDSKTLCHNCYQRLWRAKQLN